MFLHYFVFAPRGKFSIVKCFDAGNRQLELCVLERQIIKTYDPAKLKELIVKFSSLNGCRKITNICNKVSVPRSSHA